MAQIKLNLNPAQGNVFIGGQQAPQAISQARPSPVPSISLPAPANPGVASSWSAPAQQHPNVFQQLGNLVHPVYDLGKSLASTGYHVATLPVEDIRGLTASVTHNQPAEQAAANRARTGLTDARKLAQAVPQMAYQLGESLNPAGGDVYQRQHTFQSPVAQFVFGKDPVVSMQKQYKQSTEQKGKAYASGEAALTAIMDVLGGKSAKAGVVKVAPKVADVVKVDQTAHTNLLATDPKYARMQADLTKAKPEQADNIQAQMQDYRVNALQTGAVGKNVLQPGDMPGDFLKGPDEAQLAKNQAAAEAKAQADQAKGITGTDKVVAQSTGTTPEAIAAARLQANIPKVPKTDVKVTTPRPIPKGINDTVLKSIEADRKMIVNSAADEIMQAQPTRNLRKEVLDHGGISSTAYETYPKGIIRKAGQSADRMAQELGFSSENDLMDTLNSQTKPLTRTQARDQATAELESGKHHYSDSYQTTMQMLKERQNELSLYPKGTRKGVRVTKAAPKKQTDAELQSLLNTAEGQAPIETPMVTVRNKKAMRNLEAEQQVMSDFGKGKDFQELIDNYRKATGTQGQQAADDINRVLAEAGKQEMGKNPYTSNVHTVEPGNFVAARLAGSAVADNIRVAGRVADYHLEQLSKTSPSYYKDFWNIVESGKVPKGASAELQQAADWFREVANGVHKESNMLGTPTRYRQNWELRMASVKDITPDKLSLDNFDATARHAIQRKYNTYEDWVKAAQKAGLEVETDPRVALHTYITSVTSSLERKALAKSLSEADSLNTVKPHTVDLGWGTTVRLSDEGLAKTKGVRLMNDSGKVMSFYDAINSLAKGSLLSISQFHPFNISVLRAGTSLLMPKPGNLWHGDLTMGIHPVRAARGVYGTFRPLAPGGNAYVIENLAKSYNRGDVAFASQHGLPFGSTSYGELGGGFNIGHKMVFEKQLPMMHKEIVGTMRDALRVYKLKEGSPEALELGKVMNATMGFMNHEAMNISPLARKSIQRFFLAGQFTPSKLVNLYKASTKRGAAGSYARADVAANVIGAAALIGGIGYLLKQKSDNARDIALRAIINPAIPTPFKDKNGNTQEVRLPMTYTAELAHLLGLKVVRQTDGHLGVSFSPKNMPDTMAEWTKARLAPVPSAVVKVATNKNFADKPLYDPHAPAGTKVIQAATTLTQGVMPIGTQGLLYTKPVKDHLPQSVADVLDAGSPGTNPVLKSALSSIGFTPRTDQTIGKAGDTSAYFNAKDGARAGLNDAQAQLAFDLYTGSKKNPVTGKYDVQPTVWDTIAKSTALLQNPDAIDALINMNKQLKAQGKSADPLWLQPKDNIVAALEYQSIPDPFSNQRTAWYENNKSWYKPLSDARSAFFGGLPPADPNKPAQPIEYPAPTPAVQQLKDQFYALTDPTQKYQFTKAHPDLQNQLDQEFKYKNDLLAARGFSKYKAYPQATAQLDNYITSYMAADKSQRSSLRNSNPQAYQNMVSYFDSVDLYNIGSEASVNRLQGQPDYTSKEAKAISGLSRDIYKNADGTYAVVPAGWMQGLSNIASSGGSGYHSYGSKPKSGRIRVASIKAGRGAIKPVKKPTVRVSKGMKSPSSSGSIKVRTEKVRLA